MSTPTVVLHDAATGVTLTLDDGVGVLSLDQPDSPVNTLNSRLGPVFEEAFDRVLHDAAFTALVLASGKADTWIAGADIEELRGLQRAEDGAALARGGQQLLARLAQLPKPVVAAINGAALGGGLEVALACHHRIAADHPKTILALPETQLGLLPGAGGTQRLPRIVGLQAALDMILTGKNIRARKAWQMGLVHELVHPAILRDVAMRRARELARGIAPPVRKRRTGAATVLLEDNALGRMVVFRQAREQVLAKTRGNYPGPLAALDAVQRGYSDGEAAGYAAEAEHFGQLAMTPVCKQLTYLFFAGNALKKEEVRRADGTPAAHAPVRKLGVIGAGFMGAGITTVAVQAGTPVRLKDAAWPRVAAGWRAVREVVRERLRRKQLTRAQFDDTMALVGGTTDWRGFADCDLVIEAVFEDLAVKHGVVRDLEREAPRSIIASNTSTIPIRDIAAAAAHPERVLGMHFFSPVHKMPLLEVIVTPQTSPEATATAVAYGRRLGKTVIVVQDGAGFYVNRILAPYLNESGRLLDEGATIEAIDRALADYGFPVGPLTLLDEVGLDIAGKSGPIMAAAFGERLTPPATLTQVIASGRLGRKAKRGFYRYDEQGKRQGPDESVYALAPHPARQVVSADEICRRTVYPLLNEAVRCLEDGIIASPRDGDIGAVYGIGFPPFRGGPFRTIDALGAATLVRELETLDTRFPGRFTPAALLREHAAGGTHFHP
ncbi:MAG: fatty acid oxidation complex subunit alpha FadJ [Gemmatimonadetes bacterium]|nr:fatty acid oxidation complex subunit alpha FadJ [Gemmatimonadota bacterium]